MVSNHIIIPIDYETSESFLRLHARVRDGDKARALFLKLFVRLGYSMRDGQKPGYIAGEDQGLYEAALGEPLAGMVADRILSEYPGGWFCGSFAACNASRMNREQKGGFVKAHNARVARAKAELVQQTLLIKPELLVNSAGQPLSPDEINRMRVLVLNCDSALGRTSSREGWEYSDTLVANALNVLERYTDDQIEFTCRMVAGKKEHPYLVGMTTERLLSREIPGGPSIFDGVSGKIGV